MTTKTIALLVAGGISAVSAGAVAIASDVGGLTAPTHEIAAQPIDRAAAQARRAASIPDRDPSSEFAVLRRARREGDGLPSKWRPLSAVDTPRLAESRLAITSPLGAIYAVPTNRELCMDTTYLRAADRNPAETCVPTDEAAKRGAVIVLQCIDGSTPALRYVSGLIGDGVSEVRALQAGAEVTRTEVTDNAFQLEIDNPADALEFVGSGQKVRLPSPVC